MVERLNSEKKVNNDHFRIKIGTINKNNPSVIYINGSGFVSPLSKKDSYADDIEEIKLDFFKNVKLNTLKSDKLENKYACDFDLRMSGIKPNKKSFLSFQCHLKQKDGHPCRLNEIKSNLEDTINNIVENLFMDFIAHNFSVTKTKNRPIY